MKFTWIKLTGYAGIMQGILKKEIYVDFRKCKSRIITIIGDNGSGKSTLLTALSILPDDNSMFLKEYAEKSGGIIDGDTEYEFTCQHPVRTKIDENGELIVERLTPKIYFKRKNFDGTWEELNATGTVNSYRDIVSSLFCLDPNFVALSFLSTEDKGLVGKTPAERKKYVNAIISQVVVYNNIYKVLTKRNSINKSMMNNLMNKIESIGEEENLRNTLLSITARINNLNEEKGNLIKSIAEKDSMIKILDPDLSIQNLYTSIQVELERIESDKRKLSNNLSYIQTNHSFPIDTENCMILRDKNNKKIIQLENTIDNLNTSIESMLVSREEEAQAIQLKTQRMDALKSEINYIDIEKAIKGYKSNISEYERIFEDIHIKNAINISKDEYVLGLNTLKDIKEMVDSIMYGESLETIADCIGFIQSNTDLLSMKNNIDKEIEDKKIALNRISTDYTTHMGMIETLKILSNRPSKCNIDNCAFISEAVKISKMKDSPLNMSNRENELILSLQDEIKQLEFNSNYINECMIIIKDIKIILRSIDNNKIILKKLPVGNIFLDKNTFLNKLAKGEKFSEINDLYQYINYANIFEEYKIAKDALYKLEVDYKIYQSKNEVIMELNKDIEELTSKLNNIIITITESNNSIKKCKEELIELNESISLLDTVININNKMKELENSKIDMNGKINAISTNMEKINLYLSEKQRDELALQNINNNLSPLEADKDSIKYGLKMLVQYKSELESINNSYNKIEVIKKYSSPTKNGIQNLFIKVYMNQTLKLANEMLSLFFDGRLMLTGFNVEENSFSIPCYSAYSNMSVDDVSSCSRSEKTMASLTISAALLNQSSSKYNIFKLDEIDEGLDAKNRLMYIEAVNIILDRLGIEQCIMVSHSSELGLGNIDIIKLRTTHDMVIANEGNIIYEIA